MDENTLLKNQSHLRQSSEKYSSEKQSPEQHDCETHYREEESEPQEGFEAIVAKYETKIFNTALYLTGTKKNAEQVLTEVFLGPL